VDEDLQGTPLWGAIAPPGPPVAPLAGGVSADVCVVGLGGSGLCAVLAALERGARVVGVDATGIAAGAAGRNGGFLLAGVARFHHRVAAEHGRHRAVRIYRATLDEMDRMAASTPAHVRREGSLRLAVDDDELADCAEQLLAMRADGLPVETYEGPDGQGLLFPQDGVLQPAARARALAERAIAGGATLLAPAEVREVSADRVVTAQGIVESTHVLVCVDGGDLPRLVPSLAGSVRPARLQMLATAPTDEVDLRRPVYARYGIDYWQQLPAAWEGGAPGCRRVVLGGCRDVGGDEEWGAPAVPSPAVQAALEEVLRVRVGIRAAVTHRWAGVVCYSASELPVVRRAEEGVLVAGAYSGTGNVVGSLAGRALVELALDGSSELAELLDGGPPAGA
jgi:gamma-glutamylputrescine oxidase